MNDKFIPEFNEVGINDIETVGGKNTSLGEMIQNLTSMEINQSNGSDERVWFGTGYKQPGTLLDSGDTFQYYYGR